jgi:glycosyltransferase involved in cell wall biosynthesis
VSRRLPRPVVWVTAILERWLPRSADLVITPGDSRRRYFADRGIRSISVPNWVDPPTEVPTRDEARERLGIRPDQLCVTYAGALHASRDLDHLLRWAERHPDDMVLIAGFGDREAEIAADSRALANVRMLGWVPDPSDLLAAADIGYYALQPDHPYAAYAAPNNLYVAIAHGLPLVYREQGELALVGTSALIGCPFVDDASLDAAIDQLRNPEMNARVRSSLAELRESYRWEHAARALVEAYPRNGMAISKPRTKGP